MYFSSVSALVQSGAMCGVGRGQLGEKPLEPNAAPWIGIYSRSQEAMSLGSCVNIDDKVEQKAKIFCLLFFFFEVLLPFFSSYPLFQPFCLILYRWKRDDFVKRNFKAKSSAERHEWYNTTQFSFNRCFEYFEYFANEILKPRLPARFVADNWKYVAPN